VGCPSFIIITMIIGAPAEAHVAEEGTSRNTEVGGSPGSGASHAALSILGAIAFSHLLNEMMQSLLQPVVGLYTDHRPQPYSLVAGMSFTLTGLLLLSRARSFSMLLVAAAMVGVGSSVFHPESSRVARMASGGHHGYAHSLIQVGGNVGTEVGPLLAPFIVLPFGQSSIDWI
jgi:FSR family fosmidomycin resistance protein-like MFS transporter